MSSVKQTVSRQLGAVVDRAAAAPAGRLRTPAEGWLATVRKALGMSRPALAARLGVTRESVRQAEESEKAGRASLKTLEAAAQAMGCKLVYAIVPATGSLDSLIEAQARKKALALVRRASGHMALEDQSLPAARNEEEVERLAAELLRQMPPDLWSE